jgi:hypothetical protein
MVPATVVGSGVVQLKPHLAKLLCRLSMKESRMKKLMIAAAVAAGFVGLTSAVQAHRPNQGAVECPSSKDWAKCVWQEMDRNSGG